MADETVSETSPAVTTESGPTPGAAASESGIRPVVAAPQTAPEPTVPPTPVEPNLDEPSPSQAAALAHQASKTVELPPHLEHVGNVIGDPFGGKKPAWAIEAEENAKADEAAATTPEEVVLAASRYPLPGDTANALPESKPKEPEPANPVQPATQMPQPTEAPVQAAPTTQS